MTTADGSKGKPEERESRFLVLDSLKRSYSSPSGAITAIDNVSLAIQQGEFFTLLGPSGCGKTTTLRCIAGLERLDGGQITLNEEVVSRGDPPRFIPPHRRDIGMVFQNYAIWPHMTVEQNLMLPLKSRCPQLSKDDYHNRIKDALDLVGLGAYMSHMSTQMSGGQQQRLALARALIHRPSLLLLDEPLSNLDAKLRDRMRLEVVLTQRSLGVTAIYVTHDQAEALSMSDRIAVMNGGRVEQVGSPREIYYRPATRFVAEFVGKANFLTGRVTRVDDREGRVSVMTEIGEILCESFSRVQPGSGDQVTVMVRPENMSIRAVNGNQSDRTDQSGENHFRGTVTSAMFLGEYLECDVQIGQTSVTTRINPLVSGDVTGDTPVELIVRADACAVLSDDEESIDDVGE